ncbi:MAG: hypothetical protein AABW48_03720 [Nanoarchaeota archaeon]
MADKKNSLEEKVATREHIVTDQGNGVAYCSNCNYNFGPDPLKEYKICPGCNYTLTEGKIDILPGGSDF